MYGLNIVTILLIAANVIITYKGLGDFTFFEKYKFNIGAIKRGEQIRMLGSGFLHVNTQHLLFNMITLYFFANAVLRNVGELKFLLIYFGSLLAGSFLSLYFHSDGSRPDSVSLYISAPSHVSGMDDRDYHPGLSLNSGKIF